MGKAIKITNLNPITIEQDGERYVVNPYFDRPLLDFINQNNLQVGDCIERWRFDKDNVSYKRLDLSKE